MIEQSWTIDEPDRVGDADELHIAPRRKDGTLRPAVPAGAASDGPHELLAHRVSAALTAAAAFLVLALLVTVMARPRRAAATRSVDDVRRTADLAADADTPVRAPA